jgi:MarR family transcriptional regulator, transcriptional regulator for hemolysin
MEPLGRQVYLTYRTLRDRLDEDMRTAGASVPQWIVLKSVGDEPDLSQRELADRVLVTGSTLTHHLDRLEADGYITRSRDASDRRVLRVALTPEGKQRRSNLDAVVAARDRYVESLLTGREAATLNRLLATLQQRLDDEPHGQHGGADVD